MKVILFSFLTVLATTCGGESSSTGSGVDTDMAEYAEVSRSESGAPIALDQPTNRKMIWSGHVELKVANVEQTTENINKICGEFGAFVSNMNMNNSNYELSNSLTIRVESSKFMQLVDTLKKEAEYVNRASISSNDVTEKYIDIESRLKTKKEVRERYIEILANNTGNISEVLEAEEAIRKITEEIEAKEGQLRYLKDKIKYSTLSVRLYQKVTYKEEPQSYEKTFGSKIVQALKNGWSIVTGLILMLANLWPLLLVGSVFAWRWKWIKKKLRAKGKPS